MEQKQQTIPAQTARQKVLYCFMQYCAIVGLDFILRSLLRQLHIPVMEPKLLTILLNSAILFAALSAVFKWKKRKRADAHKIKKHDYTLTKFNQYIKRETRLHIIRFLALTGMSFTASTLAYDFHLFTREHTLWETLISSALIVIVMSVIAHRHKNT